VSAKFPAPMSATELVYVATWSYICNMKTVGVRELKNRLSEYLRQVRAGEAVLVTDRGEVIAELGAPGHGVTDAAVPAGLAALARRGAATLGAPGGAKLYPALPRRRGRGPLGARLLDAERGGR
jgi:antitoxin (DNA-binding transcriptional repressor) of toxin-antitoxin stability system